jgi:hypothetical protein
MERSTATPEGHVALLDVEGQLIGITIVNARWLIERDGEFAVTLPQLHGPGIRVGRCGRVDQLGIQPRIAARR